MRRGAGRAPAGGTGSARAPADAHTSPPAAKTSSARARSPTRCGGGSRPDPRLTPRLGKSPTRSSPRNHAAASAASRASASSGRRHTSGRSSSRSSRRRGCRAGRSMTKAGTAGSGNGNGTGTMRLSPAMPDYDRAVLYKPEAFEPLTEERWQVGRVRDAIGMIVADADRAFDPVDLWPAHEWDSWRTPVPLKGLYVGAAGVIFALDLLRRRGLAETKIDLAPAASRALEAWREAPEFMAEMQLPMPAPAGLFSGESGN